MSNPHLLLPAKQPLLLLSQSFGNFPILVRKDFHKIRRKVKAKIRWGEVQAQLQEEKHVLAIVKSLEDVDFMQWRWEENNASIQKLITAILMHFENKGMTIEEIDKWAKLVVTTGILEEMCRRGDLRKKKNSYKITIYGNTCKLR